MFGTADSGEVLQEHGAILESIESRVETRAHGKRGFPSWPGPVTLVSADPGRRALYQMAFGENGRLESDVQEALDSAGCEAPRGFGVEVKTSETGEKSFTIEYSAAAS